MQLLLLPSSSSSASTLSLCMAPKDPDLTASASSSGAIAPEAHGELCTHGPETYRKPHGSLGTHEPGSSGSVCAHTDPKPIASTTAVLGTRETQAYRDRLSLGTHGPEAHRELWRSINHIG